MCSAGKTLEAGDASRSLVTQITDTSFFSAGFLGDGLEGRLRRGAGLGLPDLAQIGLHRRMHGFRVLVQDFGGLVGPASLMTRSREDLSSAVPKPTPPSSARVLGGIARPRALMLTDTSRQLRELSRTPTWTVEVLSALGHGPEDDEHRLGFLPTPPRGRSHPCTGLHRSPADLRRSRPTADRERRLLGSMGAGAAHMPAPARLGARTRKRARHGSDARDDRCARATAHRGPQRFAEAVSLECRCGHGPRVRPPWGPARVADRAGRRARQGWTAALECPRASEWRRVSRGRRADPAPRRRRRRRSSRGPHGARPARGGDRQTRRRPPSPSRRRRRRCRARCRR